MHESPDDLLKKLFSARCADPFAVLGWQQEVNNSGLLLRIWRPDASEVMVLEGSSGKELGRTDHLGPGLFELHLPDHHSPCSYRLLITNHQGHEYEVADAYQFASFCDQPPPESLTDSVRWYEFFGAQLQNIDLPDQHYSGSMFRVYAPDAHSVSVIGSFNRWDGRFHPMARHSDGSWRLFIPGVVTGDLYKYEIRDRDEQLLPHKTDPYSHFIEQPPGNASIVYDHSQYVWQDQQWHRLSGMDRAVSIYEIHLGSWRKKGDRWLSYHELADELIPYILELGFTHIECLPLHEHPFTGSWGYQPVGLFAPTSRYGNPDDFKAFVDRCHQAGIGVILDWVPAHFPADSHGLARFDGSALYEYEDPKRGWHPDWQTHIYNYGKPEVRQFLISNALYWLDRFHVDGLRVDAVASMLYLNYSRDDGEWEPNELGGNEHLEAVQLLKELNEAVYQQFPDAMMIAEESSSWPGVSWPTYDNGLGFGYKWNMGWMHDSLEYMKRFPEHRAHHHDQMMFSMAYNYDEHFILPLSHDEVVHAKGTLLSRMPGDEWQRFANLRAYYGFMFGHPGKKLLFMGAEIGSEREWNHDGELDWFLIQENAFCRGLKTMLQDLNRFYRDQPALWHADYDPGGFGWLVTDDWQQSVFAFHRQACKASMVVVVSNMTPVVRNDYRIGVPASGGWKEVFNTDAVVYGGGGVANEGELQTETIALHQQSQSLLLTLPPLATVFLVPLAK